MYGHPDWVAQHAASLKPPEPVQADQATKSPDAWIDAALMAAYEDRGDIE